MHLYNIHIPDGAEGRQRVRGLWGVLGVGRLFAISYVVAVNALSDENDSHLGGLFAAPWTVVRQAPPSWDPRAEYWRGCHLPPGLPDPAMEPISLRSPAMAGRFFPSRATWERWHNTNTIQWMA